MEIVKVKATAFGSVPVGGVFNSKGNYYLKFEAPEGSNNDAVNLESGKTTNFADSSIVELVNGSFIEE